MLNNLFRAPHEGLKLCKSIGLLCKESAFRRDNTRFDNNNDVAIRTNPVNMFMQNRYVYNNKCLLVYHKILWTYFFHMINKHSSIFFLSFVCFNEINQYEKIA